MMAAPSFLSILVMVFASAGGNDLLDFVPADAYFRLSKIEQTVPALTALLDAPLPEDERARPGDSARRQMALRALAKLKDPAALPAIDKAARSDDPLVADYARAAKGAIAGEKYVRPPVSGEDLAIDLACLPSGLGVVGCLTASSGSGGAIDIARMFAPFAEEEGGPDMEEMETQLVTQMGQAIAAVGNVRVGALTFGVASQVGDNAGFVVALARGLYDHEAVERLLGERIGGVRRKGGGLTFYELESDHVYVAPVSDELFVFIAGASREELPLDEVGRKVAAGGGDFALGKNLAKMLDGIDRKAPIWVLMEMSEAYKQVPFLAPFDTAQLVGQAEGGLLKLALDAKGDDPEAAKAVVDEINAGLAKARKEIAEEKEFPGAEMVREILASVVVKSDGGSASMGAKLNAGNALSVLPMMFFGDSSRAIEVPPDLEEAAPLEKEPEVAPAEPEEPGEPAVRRRAIVLPPAAPR